jgi:hypothetical protein
MMMTPDEVMSQRVQSHQRQPHQRRFRQLKAALLIGLKEDA